MVYRLFNKRNLAFKIEMNFYTMTKDILLQFSACLWTENTAKSQIFGDYLAKN